MSKTINSILEKYYNEANKGLNNNKVPSSLNRGEGTEKEYYILKIDLVRSTTFLINRFPQTYLKLAHVFLSSVDEITREFGADSSQVEYAGDSVLAYFDAKKVPAINVLKAAYYAKEATLQIKPLDPVFKRYNFKTRVVLHYGKLIVAKIGPWGDHKLSAIGKEIHKVGKLEKSVPAEVGHVTKEFAKQLELKTRRKLLRDIYITNRIEVKSAPVPSCRLQQSNRTLLTALLKSTAPPVRPTLRGLLGHNQGLASASKSTILTEHQPQPTYKTEKILTHWEIKWLQLERYTQD